MEREGEILSTICGSGSVISGDTSLYPLSISHHWVDQHTQDTHNNASINQNFNTEFLLVPGSYYLYLLSCCCWKSCIFSLVFSSNLSFCKEKLNTGNIVLVQELCSLHAADNSYLNCSTSCSTRVDSDVKLE